MIKNNFRILKKQYAYLQTILKTPVKFQKDWPKTVGGVADTRMVVGADGRTDARSNILGLWATSMLNSHREVALKT